MGLIRTIARRSLLQRPARTLFSVLGIGVGIATVVAIFTLDHNTLLGRAGPGEREWQADIEVSPSVVVRKPREELREVPGVTHVMAAFQNDIVARTQSGEPSEPVRAHFVALEPEHALELGVYHIEEGRTLSGEPAVEAGDALPREALVGQALAKSLSLELGDTLLLSRPARAPGRECVDGEWVQKAGRPPVQPPALAFEVVGVLSREGLGRRARGEVCIVNYEHGLQLFEGAHIAKRYWLRQDGAVNLESLQSDLGRAWSYDLKRSVIIGQAADERAFRNGVRFAGLLALVLGLYVIFHTLSMSLVERVREVSVLHALGTTRRQIALVFLTEALIVAGLGGVLGLAGGLALAKLMLLRGITTVGLGHPVLLFEIPWASILPLAGAGVGIALLGSVYPLVRVRRAASASGLRTGEVTSSDGVGRGFRIFATLLLALVLPFAYVKLVPIIGETQSELMRVLLLGLGVLGLFVAVPFVLPSTLARFCAWLARPLERRWPLAGKLAVRSMQMSPTRVAGAAAGIALVTAAFVGLRGMTSSLVGEIRTWCDEAVVDKVFVRKLPRVKFEALAREIGKYPGVLGVEPNDARTYSPFLIVGVKPGQLESYGPCSRDPELLRRMRQENGIILTPRLARHRGYAVGDLVHVQTAQKKVESLPVIAISDAYGYFPHPDERLYGVVSDAFMARAYCIDTDVTEQIVVRLERGADMGVVETAVRDFMPGQEGMRFDSGPALYDWYRRDIAQDFRLFDIILALTAALAALGVLNGMLLSALERAKELGILRALGMTRSQVAGTVLIEALVVGGIGGTFGLALGLGLAPVIVGALEVISGLTLPSPALGPYVAFAWGGAVLLATVAALYPIWRMNRVSTVAAVRNG